MISELEIIKKCIEGDKFHQKLLYKKYASTMLGICFRYFKSREEAEDVLQEGFIKVFNNLGKFKGEGSFEGWIKKIMVNTAINSYRSNLKHYYHSDVQEIEEHVIMDEKNVNKDFSEDDLMKIIQSLPEGFRIVFNLYVIEGYTHKEIGEMLNISDNTSKSQLSRARVLLQKKIAETKEIQNTQKTILSS